MRSERTDLWIFFVFDDFVTPDMGLRNGPAGRPDGPRGVAANPGAPLAGGPRNGAQAPPQFHERFLPLISYFSPIYFLIIFVKSFFSPLFFSYLSVFHDLIFLRHHCYNFIISTVIIPNLLFFSSNPIV